MITNIKIMKESQSYGNFQSNVNEELEKIINSGFKIIDIDTTIDSNSHLIFIIKYGI